MVTISKTVFQEPIRGGSFQKGRLTPGLSSIGLFVTIFFAGTRGMASWPLDVVKLKLQIKRSNANEPEL